MRGNKCLNSGWIEDVRQLFRDESTEVTPCRDNGTKHGGSGDGRAGKQRLSSQQCSVSIKPHSYVKLTLSASFNPLNFIYTRTGAALEELIINTHVRYTWSGLGWTRLPSELP